MNRAVVEERNAEGQDVLAADKGAAGVVGCTHFAASRQARDVKSWGQTSIVLPAQGI